MDVFFPETLREVRNKKGLRCKDVAGMVGRHKDTISKIENGEYKPTRQMMEQLADALGISRDELFKEETKLTNVETIRRVQQYLMEKLNVIVDVTNKINAWLEGSNEVAEDTASLCVAEIMNTLKEAQRCTK